MTWTPEKVKTLSKLWASGLSASQISLEMGEFTRNAVIGKIHRLKLPSRVTKTVHINARKRIVKNQQFYERYYQKLLKLLRAKTPMEQIVVQVGMKSATISRLRRQAIISGVELPPLPAKNKRRSRYTSVLGTAEAATIRMNNEQVPITAITLIDLERPHCRWPVGKAVGRNQLFCGQKKDNSPYCPHHHAMGIHV